MSMPATHGYRLATVVLAWLSLGLANAAPATASERAGDPLALVNPFMGTAASAPDFGTGGGAGNTYPGATAPFGMLNWSPDTDPSTLNFPGGYTYGDGRIKGFSLTHISGAGCAAYGDFPLIPTSAGIDGAPTKPGSSDLDPRYLASFDHEHEQAEPGFYSVTLDPGDPSRSIEAALTADVRAGLGRFRFAPGASQGFLLNAGGSSMANRLARVSVDPDAREISGVAESGNFCYSRPWYRVYFAARFDRRFESFGTWRNTALSPGSRDAKDTAVDPTNYKPIPGGPPSLPGNPSGTAQAGAYVRFDPADGRTVRVRVGVSFTSAADARANLEAEVPDFDFAAEREQASARWQRALGRIRVTGGTRTNLRTFYSSLYHALVAPRTFSDADGSYRGMDDEVHSIGSGQAHYADLSLWDTYRTQIPLLALAYPRRAGDVAASLVADAEQSGCLPKWGYANGQTMVQVGDPAAIALAVVDALGRGGFDRAAALRAMLRGADRECRSKNGDYLERQGLAGYLERGWVGHELNQNSGAATSRFGTPEGVWGSAATTLEYAAADFAIARFAGRSCAEDVYGRMMQRSGNWRRIFNPDSGYIEPRLSTGAFSPTAAPDSGDGFVEGSSAQYTTMVPFDPAGLAGALGGRPAAVARLDDLFGELNDGPESEHAFLGNEPNLNAPWLYDWWGRPDRTQEVVRQALLELYSPRADGYPGNDDLGTLSSWWVLGALGLYPAVPGERDLALGSPLFQQADLQTGSGRLRIVAPKASPQHWAVRALEVDGVAHEEPWLRLPPDGSDTTLRFDLASRAQPWARGPGSAPPSYGPNRPLSGC